MRFSISLLAACASPFGATGILPGTPPETVAALVDTVAELLLGED